MNPLLIERRDRQVWLTLNRPSKLNAFDRETRESLTTAIRAAGADDACRVVVVTASGDRAFSVGQDLAELAELDAAGGVAWLRGLADLLDAVRALDKPSLVAINGFAYGMGLQIALHADYRIAAEHARFGLREIDSGMASILGPWIMRAAFGLAAARSMTLSGRAVTAVEAYNIGAVDELASARDLQARSLACAAALAAAPPLAVALTKRRLRRLTEADWQATVAYGEEQARIAFGAGEPQKMARAFLEGRAGDRSATE